MFLALESRAPSKNRLAFYLAIGTSRVNALERWVGPRPTHGALRHLAFSVRTMEPVLHGALWLLQGGRKIWRVQHRSVPCSSLLPLGA